MKQLKRIGALALALCLALGVLSGCQGGETSSGSEEVVIDLAEVTDPYEATSGLKADAVVATVGGQDITAESLLYWLGTYTDQNMQYYMMMGQSEMPWDQEMDGSTLAEAMKDAALQMAAMYAILPAKAQELELTVSEDTMAENQAVLDQMAQSLGGQEFLQYYLWQYPLTEELFLSLCAGDEAAALIQEALYGENGSEKPTDAQILSYATDELGLYRAKHILLKTVDTEKPLTDEEGNPTGQYEPLDEATVAAKKALAEDILAQLDAGGDPLALFDALMQEHSEDEGLESNPDGYTASQGQMVQPFEQAALALNDGEHSQIVESVYGYHIILRLPLDPDDYQADYVSYRMGQLQSQWLDEEKISTKRAFDKLDPADFYTRLTALRDAITQEMTAQEEQPEGSASGETSDSSTQSE